MTTDMAPDMVPVDAYGALTGPMTLTIQRILPGPVERIWDYLTDGALRARWLAAGEMEPRVGGAAEFIWRNDELTDPPGAKPQGFGAEHRMKATVTEYDPPRRLAFTWEETGGVAITLEPKGTRVLLTLTHRDLPRRSMLLGVSAGWHAHLDVLVARARSVEPAPFWDAWARLRAEYDARLPA
ncbi:SRPBCC family protein [Amaricoccus solimangrovi]|uniref:SRPBCC family protein n=2 Tax=Amaricoccus solimangrovi TaxID=2589815 RepID=A0A501WXU5_9RHOB|nr:SRPBCC family protein [Amaricoccus solimangrovi]